MTDQPAVSRRQLLQTVAGTLAGAAFLENTVAAEKSQQKKTGGRQRSHCPVDCVLVFLKTLVRRKKPQRSPGNLAVKASNSWLPNIGRPSKSTVSPVPSPASTCRPAPHL